ncbi:MAG: GIY-YIG nuclease family protein, partial [Deltaproteobacteria bacterium]|nr:GIY-YIG nuclease family protein [Deltaproteobacteria bacterium]
MSWSPNTKPKAPEPPESTGPELKAAGLETLGAGRPLDLGPQALGPAPTAAGPIAAEEPLAAEGPLAPGPEVLEPALSAEGPLTPELEALEPAIKAEPSELAGWPGEEPLAAEVKGQAPARESPKDAAPAAAETAAERLARLKRLALDLPASPGVYLMSDRKGQIVYVGKAKVLPRRVSGYFRESGLAPRVALLVSQVESFEVVVVNTEKEALILENSLIKKHRPRFNVVLRDDKTYPSLRLNFREPFPFLEIVRRPVKDGSIVYGPFPSAGALRETV